MLEMWVARNTDRRTSIPTDSSDLSALQPHRDVPATPSLIIFFRDDRSIRPGAAAELTTFAPGDSDIVDEGSNRYHVQRQTVAPPRRLRSQHARVDDSSHAVQQILRYASSVALYRVTSPHAICSNNVRLLRSILGSEKCNMRASSRIMLDPFDDLPTGCPAREINGSDPPFMPATSVSDRHSPRIVPAT